MTTQSEAFVQYTTVKMLSPSMFTCKNLEKNAMDEAEEPETKLMDTSPEITCNSLSSLKVVNVLRKCSCIKIDMLDLF